ncbi:unnamed protein product [Meloidogyne enterolobii]|uniref:Uncharacterized protein n=1 Tax=Meloidogyne enterolobii TaxID=390850 RepID=A0ACB0XZ72_MELEN
MPTQKSVRFDLRELQAQISEEQQRQNVLFNITERFPGFFELPERCIPFQFDDNQQIQQNEGFPQVLKNVLFNEEKEGQQQNSSQKEKEKIFTKRGQKSLFSQHFDSSKLKGNKKEEKKEEEHLINETIKNLEIIGLVEKNEKEAKLIDGGSGAHLAMVKLFNYFLN